MATDLEIANLALRRIRANQITDETATTDTSKAAQAVAAELELTKRNLLVGTAWKVATELITVSVDATAPPEPWTGRYVLSTAETAESHLILAVRDARTADCGVSIDFERAADRTGSAHVSVIYADYDDDLTLECAVEIATEDMPEEIANIFAWRLAEVIALPLTGSLEKAQYCSIKAEQARQAAFAVNLHQSSRRTRVRAHPRHSALAARRGRLSRLVEGEGP